MSVLKKIRSSFIALTLAFLSVFSFSTPVLADPTPAVPTAEQTQDSTSSSTEATQSASSTQNAEDTTDVCYTESGSLGWLVCPSTGFLAKITDSLYGLISKFLIVSPIFNDTSNPYHQVWSIFRDITNIVFVIFLLVVILSQLTGVGISNYGIKRALPKIILSAILINLSYPLCALLVDVSNIAGASLRDIFSEIETQIVPTGILASAANANTALNYSELVAALSGATILGGIALGASGGLGYVFISLISVLIGAVVAVAIAFITIAARQAFVYFLIMISPLAFVCLLLPNTEKWFESWKKALSQMLIFYPMFAALFGACSLIGWVIIAAAEEPVFIVFGLAIKVIPLVSAFSLLKMSGTLPGQVSSALHKFASKPVGAAQGALKAEALHRRARYLGGSASSYQYSRHLAQYLDSRRVRRDSDTKKYLDSAALRGQAYAAKIQNRSGKITRRGEEIGEINRESILNSAQIARTANIYEEGLSLHTTSDRQRARLAKLDYATLDAALDSYYTSANGERIRLANAKSRADLINQALDAGTEHYKYGRPVNPSDLARYKRITTAVDGDVLGAELIGANATADAANLTAVANKKFNVHFSSMPPTQHLQDRVELLIKDTNNLNNNIDHILTGLTAINMRGDTDIVTDLVVEALNSGQIKLGTHASQSLANFCMFNVKDSDVTLRRYGKYINLETARVFNEGQSKGKRKNTTLSWNEYITGVYDEYDDDGNLIPGKGSSKLSIAPLLMGTSLEGAERTTFDNLNRRLRDAYTDRDGNVDYEAFKKKRDEVNNAMLPAIINAALKYPSGSEQGINLATYITGLKPKADGTFEKCWEDPKNALFGLDESYFAKFIQTYLKAQVPSQITAIRTDTFGPMVEVLGDDYIERLKKHQADPEHNPDPADSLPASVIPPSNDIPDILNQKPEKILSTDSPAERERKKAANLELAKKQKAARDEYARANFIGILHQSKTLGPIVRSLSSGSVNSAKRVVRDFMGVNEEDPFTVLYKDELREKRQAAVRRIRAKKRGEATEEETEETPIEPTSETGADSTPLYDEERREEFKDTYTEWSERDYADEEQFVSDVTEDLMNYGLDYEATQFSDFFDRNPDASISELLGVLKRILDESPNF